MMRSVPDGRLDEIADEVFDLMGIADIFDFIGAEPRPAPDLENRLQVIMQSRQSFECIELAMYLRTSYSRRDFCPTWNPLLNATVELIRERGEDLVMLYGVVPNEPGYTSNTNGMTGPRHPQMRQK